MKKTTPRRLAVSLSLVALVLGLARPALAGETIVYPGAFLRTCDKGENALCPAFSPSDNSVTLNSGGAIPKFVFGGVSDTDVATNNTVILNGGTVDWGVYGGHSSSGAATHNTVTVNGGTVSRSFSGGSVVGGWTASGDATNNTVTVNGGTVNGFVYGGHSSSGAATHNTVTMTGGVVSRKVYGGYVGEGNGAATNNTVNLGGAVTFGPNTYLWGGFGTGDTFSGNTLNILGGTHTLKTVSNFQTYTFVLPANAPPNPLLTAQGIYLTDGKDLTATIGLCVKPETRLVVGTTYTLMKATDILTGNLAPRIQKVPQGDMVYEIKVEQVGKTLTATVVSVTGQGKP